MTEPQYLQARSTQGFKIHAVPASAQRVGAARRMTFARVACGKIKGRDSMAFPTLMIQGPADNPTPFTTDAPLPLTGPVCAACWHEVRRAAK